MTKERIKDREREGWKERERGMERERERGLERERGGKREGGNEASDWLYTSSPWKLIGRALEATNLSTLLGKCSATNYEG